MFLAKENRLKNVTALGAMMKKKLSMPVGHLVVAIGESTLYDEKPVMVINNHFLINNFNVLIRFLL